MLESASGCELEIERPGRTVKPTHEIGELPAFVANRARQVVGKFAAYDSRVDRTRVHGSKGPWNYAIKNGGDQRITHTRRQGLSFETGEESVKQGTFFATLRLFFAIFAVNAFFCAFYGFLNDPCVLGLFRPLSTPSSILPSKAHAEGQIPNAGS